MRAILGFCAFLSLTSYGDVATSPVMLEANVTKADAILLLEVDRIENLSGPAVSRNSFLENLDISATLALAVRGPLVPGQPLPSGTIRLYADIPKHPGMAAAF